MRTIRPLAALLLFASPAAAQTMWLTHDAAVHTTWASTSPIKAHLHEGDSVTALSHRAGYTHIAPHAGVSGGWVYSRYLSDSLAATSIVAPTLPAPPSLTTTASGIAALPKIPPVEAHSAVCPDTGSRKPGSPIAPDTLTNLLKNRIDDGSYAAVTFDAMLALPWQGMPTKRSAWHTPDFQRTKDYEGAGVSLTGYIVDVEPKSMEMCNCEQTDPDWVDWHIWLVETKAEAVANDKRRAVVVETAPRVRQKFSDRFDLTQTRAWKKSHDRVTISGWLMLDPDHPSDATGTPKKNPSRGTIWEIHPVMKIEPSP